jgi:hypothetical protein
MKRLIILLTVGLLSLSSCKKLSISDDVNSVSKNQKEKTSSDESLSFEFQHYTDYQKTVKEWETHSFDQIDSAVAYNVFSPYAGTGLFNPPTGDTVRLYIIYLSYSLNSDPWVSSPHRHTFKIGICTKGRLQPGVYSHPQYSPWMVPSKSLFNYTSEADIWQEYQPYQFTVTEYSNSDKLSGTFSGLRVRNGIMKHVRITER